MTTDNATELRAGTLVLNNSRVRVYAFTEGAKHYAFHERPDGKASTEVDWMGALLPIGHPDDGWMPHTGSECPVGADELVEFAQGTPNDGKLRRRARDLVWNVIKAYRLAPNPTHQDAEARGEGDSQAALDEERARRESVARLGEWVASQRKQAAKPDPQPIAPQHKTEVAHAFYRIAERLGAQSDTLSIFGSYGDTLSDADVLENAEGWLAGSPSAPQPIDPSDLRPIADEMRHWLTNGSVAVGTIYIEDWVWRLDKLLPQRVESMKCGDRVRDRYGDEYTIRFIDEDGEALLRNGSDSSVSNLSELQPITPEKAS